MSIISGIWQYSKECALGSTFEKMHLAISHFPHDGTSLKIVNNAAVGSLFRLNVPETANNYNANCRIFGDERFLFVAQGKVDNRSNIIRELNIQSPSSISDEFLMYRAYLSWEEDSVNYLKGSWSFAVFDFNRQQLFLARDTMGYTALYYYFDTTGFFFSSSLKCLLALPNYSKKLNELNFVRRLSLWEITKTTGQTNFEGIYALPNGCCARVKERKIHLKKYWQPELISLRHYRNKRVYSNEMMDVFTKAVECQLKGFKPVASMLSGGLDSSAVSFIAAELMKAQNTKLTTLSHVPHFSKDVLNKSTSNFRTLDERSFIDDIANSSGNIHTVLINSADKSILQAILDVNDIYSSPIHACSNAYWILDLYSTAVKMGFGSLLTGEGGNGSISFRGLSYLLSIFELQRLLMHPITFLNQQVVIPFLNNFKLNKTQSSDSTKYILGIFLRNSIIEKYNIIKSVTENKKALDGPVQNINERKLALIDVYNFRSSFGSACTHNYGIELRDPTTDKDVMEYFFSIPNEVFFDAQYQNRMLIKRMMKGKIPDRVLYEKKKGLQSSDIFYRVKSQANEITEAINTISKSPAADYYIDTKQLSEKWSSYLSQSYVEAFEIQRILKALGFALFLQKYFD